jgi:hypothetical protein
MIRFFLTRTSDHFSPTADILAHLQRLRNRWFCGDYPQVSSSAVALRTVGDSATVV